MSATAPAVASAVQATSVPQDYTLAPLTVEQYHAMARAGILEEGAPIELLEGFLVEKVTKHPPHSVATQLVQEALVRIAPDGWRAVVQEPVTLSDSEPEPDVVLVRGKARDYRLRHPGPDDVALVVEISDATLGRDRGSKRRIYARAGIAVYWIVNLIEAQVEVYVEPSGHTAQPTFRRQETYLPGDEIPLLVDGVRIGQIAVDNLLP